MLVFAALLAAPFCLSRDLPKGEEDACTRLLCRLLTHEQEHLLSPRLVAGQHPVVARLECRLVELGRLLGRFTRVKTRAGIGRARDDRFAHDAGPQTAGSRTMPSENKMSKIKECAVHEAMEALTSSHTRQEDASFIHDQKCSEAAVAETNYTNAIQDVFGRPKRSGNTLRRCGWTSSTSRRSTSVKRSSSGTKKPRTN